eukprot:2976176-Rhodomonas_salina.2
MSGTASDSVWRVLCAYALALRYAVLTQRMACYAVLCYMGYWPSVWCYAMSGTDIAYGACYAPTL